MVGFKGDVGVVNSVKYKEMLQERLKASSQRAVTQKYVPDDSKGLINQPEYMKPKAIVCIWAGNIFFCIPCFTNTFVCFCSRLSLLNCFQHAFHHFDSHLVCRRAMPAVSACSCYFMPHEWVVCVGCTPVVCSSSCTNVSLTHQVQSERNVFKRARMEPTELRDELFKLFEKQKYYSLSELISETQQPKVCVFAAMCWR